SPGACCRDSRRRARRSRTEAGAVAVGTLRAHGFGQFSELLHCGHAPLPSFLGRPPSRRRNPNPDHLNRLAASLDDLAPFPVRTRPANGRRVNPWPTTSSSSLTPCRLLASSFSARRCSALWRGAVIRGRPNTNRRLVRRPPLSIQ